ncbi:MAG: hypothetical protein JAY64_19105 [Candidatus Thiodiazotropha weberae]|nr:hypothetical protein [Candidatus Thiodiazotropha lotti]MCW4213264.1 hypothetical protein [Candidatus Thiodiazotropha lotti]
MTDAQSSPATHSNQARRKQTLVTVSIVVLVFGGILLGLYLTDPQRQLPSQSDQVSTDEEVTEHFSLPGKQVDPREMWISRGEADISALKQSNVEFQSTIDELREEIAVLRQDQARTSRLPAPTTQENTTGPTSFPALPLPPPPQKQVTPSN